MHTDIKRRNLGLDAQGDMSILDWNGATKIGDTQTLPQYTPKYSALELKFEEKYTRKQTCTVWLVLPTEHSVRP